MSLPLLGAGPMGATAAPPADYAAYDYTSDFAGSPPANVSAPWTSTLTYPVQNGGPLPSGKYVVVDLNVNTPTPLSYDRFQPSADIDLFAICSTPSVDPGTPRNLGLIIQGSGDGSTKGGYVTALDGSLLRVRKWVNNVSTDFTNVSYAIATDTLYGKRFRHRAGRLQIRMWQWGQEAEPATWLFDIAEDSITTAGFAGTYGQRQSGFDHYHFVSANWAGGTAPVPS